MWNHCSSDYTLDSSTHGLHTTGHHCDRFGDEEKSFPERKSGKDASLPEHYQFVERCPNCNRPNQDHHDVTKCIRKVESNLQTKKLYLSEALTRLGLGDDLPSSQLNINQVGSNQNRIINNKITQERTCKRKQLRRRTTDDGLKSFIQCSTRSSKPLEQPQLKDKTPETSIGRKTEKSSDHPDQQRLFETVQVKIPFHPEDELYRSEIIRQAPSIADFPDYDISWIFDKQHSKFIRRRLRRLDIGRSWPALIPVGIKIHSSAKHQEDTSGHRRKFLTQTSHHTSSIDHSGRIINN